jgi:phosphoribosylglycinamide formyltransferase-1
VVLLSGAGTNLEALLLALPGSGIPAEVVAVGSDQEASGVRYAADRGIATFMISPHDYSSREAWGNALAEEIDTHRPDLVVLSGFMKLLPPGMVSRFSPRIINTHPSYLPEFPGAHAVREALASGASHTGASVIVVDEGIDTGKILAQERVAIVPGETEKSLHGRIKLVERALLLEVLADHISGITKEKAHHELP